MVLNQSLKKLFGQLQYTCLQGEQTGDIDVTEVIVDSRLAGKGALFVAIRGENLDGHDFVAEAAKKSAAVVVEKGWAGEEKLAGLDAAIFEVENTREALGTIASTFYNFPQEEITLIGITGTNGKTTTTYLLEKVLSDQGQRVGVIGTVSYRYTNDKGEQFEDAAPLTTPDVLDLHKMLRQMADSGVTVVLMEVSSHALIQGRLKGLSFDIAAFTNLSHDHLDYHGSMEEYYEAKTLLFLDYLKKSGKAVVTFTESAEIQSNRWPSDLVKLVEQHDIDYLTCGYQKGSIVRPNRVEIKIDQTSISLSTPEGDTTLVSPLVGRFNVDNIMTTLAIGSSLGYQMDKAIDSLALANGAPGRLERVFLSADKKPEKAIFVDYAHTPDALLNVLKTLRALPHKRLICVFGCGGDRDTSKRPEMGKIAAQLADLAIVTDDNPRTESSERIIEQILEGIRPTGLVEIPVEHLIYGDQLEKGYAVISDRRTAIHTAVGIAGTNDIVVIAGKGHEKYQLTNEGKRFFDDTLEAREALLLWDIGKVSEALAVQPLNGETHFCFTGVCTDTRKIERGDLFVALVGESFDGHDYLQQAADQGAGGLVVASSYPEHELPKLPVYRVEDTLEALGRLAGHKRKVLQSISAPLVVGITGSTGKTSVKEMTSAIFQKQWPDGETNPPGRVLKTQGNFNNLVGLPLSMLPLELKHRVAVLEMGMNIPGEIAQLAKTADPDISCVVNVHGAHLEGVGTIEGVAREKGQLFAQTRETGIFALNLDDIHVASAALQYSHRKICYTMNPDLAPEADLYGSDVRNRRDGCISFTLHIGEEFYPIDLQVPGQHNVSNGLAAAAIGVAAGLDHEVIIAGLESFTAADKRLEVIQSPSGYSVINDTYNANPASMRAGLATLGGMKGETKIAVLGDMLELGEGAAYEHQALGKVAGEMGLTFLLMVGNFTKEISNGALASGMAENRIVSFSDKNEVAGWIKQQLNEKGKLTGDTWIFVKASRGMRLETVVERLLEA